MDTERNRKVDEYDAIDLFMHCRNRNPVKCSGCEAFSLCTAEERRIHDELGINPNIEFALAQVIGILEEKKLHERKW